MEFIIHGWFAFKNFRRLKCRRGLEFLLFHYGAEESVLILLDGDGVRALDGVGDVAPGDSVGTLLESSGEGQREADLACLRILGDGSASQRGFFRSGTYCRIPRSGDKSLPFCTPISLGTLRIIDNHIRWTVGEYIKSNLRRSL